MKEKRRDKPTSGFNSATSRFSKTLALSLSFLQKVKRERKRRSEFEFWERFNTKEKLSHSHFVYFYTTHFGLNERFCDKKRVLDVGCGPCGSLEWADMASERIGLDPLVNSYRKLGINGHKMRYVSACAEKIPFPDGYFDIVSSFNSLDHIDDLDKSIKELIRVIAPGGLFLLLTDLHDIPAICEPITYSWEIVERFLPDLKLIEERHYERVEDGMYQSVQAGISYNHANKLKRQAVLSAKFIKPL